jgi:hypothetical protein
LAGRTAFAFYNQLPACRANVTAAAATHGDDEPVIHKNLREGVDALVTRAR